MDRGTWSHSWCLDVPGSWEGNRKMERAPSPAASCPRRPRSPLRVGRGLEARPLYRKLYSLSLKGNTPKHLPPGPAPPPLCPPHLRCFCGLFLGVIDHNSQPPLWPGGWAEAAAGEGALGVTVWGGVQLLSHQDLACCPSSLGHRPQPLTTRSASPWPPLSLPTKASEDLKEHGATPPPGPSPFPRQLALKEERESEGGG